MVSNPQRAVAGKRNPMLVVTGSWAGLPAHPHSRMMIIYVPASCAVHFSYPSTHLAGFLVSMAGYGDPQVITANSANDGIVSWSNTGFLDAATAGQYAFTDLAFTPSGATGKFDGLMLHPDLPKIYVRLSLALRNHAMRHRSWSCG